MAPDLIALFLLIGTLGGGLTWIASRELKEQGVEQDPSVK